MSKLPYVSVGRNLDSDSRVSHRGGEVGARPLAVCCPRRDIGQNAGLEHAGTRHSHVAAESGRWLEREQERERAHTGTARARGWAGVLRIRQSGVSRWCARERACGVRVCGPGSGCEEGNQEER